MELLHVAGGGGGGRTEVCEEAVLLAAPEPAPAPALLVRLLPPPPPLLLLLLEPELPPPPATTAPKGKEVGKLPEEEALLLLSQYSEGVLDCEMKSPTATDRQRDTDRQCSHEVISTVIASQSHGA